MIGVMTTPRCFTCLLVPIYLWQLVPEVLDGCKALLKKQKKRDCDIMLYFVDQRMVTEFARLFCFITLFYEHASGAVINK